MNDGVLPLSIEGNKIILVDQRKLPESLEYFDATLLDDMCFAIQDMVVRGAPSIGVAAAAGLAAHARHLSNDLKDMSKFVEGLAKAKAKLQATRPTAVNLRWATQRLYQEGLHASRAPEATPALVADALMRAAQEMLNDHMRINQTLSQYGAELFEKRAQVLTHCNAGSLATCGWGTALGVIRTAKLKGLEPKVYVDETRPRNQGARLTMWELHQDKIDATLICDSMAGYLMANKKVDLVVTGADRIAANGDTANKIGTYTLAVLASHHGIPFYIAAPLSTIDPTIESGAQIPIEERAQSEVLAWDGTPHTVQGARAFNPAFDVTPNQLITGIITEAGVLYPMYEDSIRQALERSLIHV